MLLPIPGSEPQLPIQVSVNGGESGYSFLLRACSANHVNLHWLRRTLGLAEVGDFTRHHAAMLAFVCQGDTPWLNSQLPPPVKFRPLLGFWQSQALYAFNHARGQWPQICPTCVHHDGFCHSVWDLSWCVLCPKHGTWLIDQCITCGKRIRWDRPSVDICNCGSPFLAPKNAATPEPELVMQFSTYLKQCAMDINCTPRECGLCLHETLNQLSLPGVLALISCFGARFGAHQALPSARFQKLGRTVDSIALVSRGLQRLTELHSTALKDWPFELVDLILLQRMFENAFHTGDTFVAREILLASNLMPVGLTAQLRAQMSLFEDGGS